jgi:hypothetical protein
MINGSTSLFRDLHGGIGRAGIYHNNFIGYGLNALERLPKDIFLIIAEVKYA